MRAPLFPTGTEAAASFIQPTAIPFAVGRPSQKIGRVNQDAMPPGVYSLFTSSTGSNK
jgi:hypothetical protein